MPRLTVETIAAWMDEVGWSPASLGVQVYDDGSIKVVNEAAKKAAIGFYDVAMAVCFAESEFDTQAKNPDSSARGLWQIMVSVHTDMIKQEQAYWYDELHLQKYPTIFHPAVNTGVAHRLYNARGWQPWETHNKGTHKKYMGKGWGERAWRVTSGVGLTEAQRKEKVEELRQEHMLAIETAKLAGVLTPGGALMGNDLVTNPVGSVLAFLREAGVTIGVFLLGLILLILGIWFLISQTKVGTAVKGITKRVPGV